MILGGRIDRAEPHRLANLIATAVSDGKKVLFVAEKMAALEVVKRRLENVGDPSTSHWRGVNHPPVMRHQAEDLIAATAVFEHALARVTTEASALAAHLGLPIPATIAEIETQCAIGERLARAPGPFQSFGSRSRAYSLPTGAITTYGRREATRAIWMQ